MKNLFLLLTILLGLNSCNSWLDVQPYDRVAEDVVFNSVTGFENALNGIYIELNTSTLYGQYLSCEMIEIMAQRYNINKSNFYNYDLMLHKYTEEGCKMRFEGLWGKAYNLIANINLLLKNCDVHREILSDEYYALLKGECHALRALLHFDIFRLFGPVYGPDEKAVGLPYYKEFSLDKRVSYKPEEFMNFVIADLHSADSLLKNDPVLIEGTEAIHDKAFVSQRKYRLNKYGVQLLLARAELYRGNKEAALVAARKVIDAQEQWFPWVKREAISSGRVDPDRVFYTEILWGLQNSNLSVLYTSLFDGANLAPEMMLAPLGGQVDQIFDNNRDDKVEVAAGCLAQCTDPAREMLITSDGKLYLRDAWDIAIGGIFDFPRNRLKGGSEYFKVSPFIGYKTYWAWPTTTSAILYDETNRRFVALESREDYLTELAFVGGSAEYSAETGRDLVHMEGNSEGYVFAVLQEPDKEEYYLYGMMLNPDSKVERSHYMRLNAANSDKIIKFAFHPLFRLLFYATEQGDIYQFNMNTPEVKAKKILSFPNEHISVLKFNLPVPFVKYEDWEKLRWYWLYIASYDKTKDESVSGVLRMYEFPEITSAPVQHFEFKNMGKIVDISYRYRNDEPSF